MGGISASEFKQLKDELKDQPEKLKALFLNCAFKVSPTCLTHLVTSSTC